MTDDDGELALLGETLDRSFGAGPVPLPTPAERLAGGRRALRRRRGLTVVATSLAVAATVSVGAVLAGAGGDHGASAPRAPIATQGTTAKPSVTATSPDEVVDAQTRKSRQAQRDAKRSLTDTVPATYDALGDLAVKDGWTILQHVDEPMGLRPPEASVGLVVTNGQQTRWLLVLREHAVSQDGTPVANAFGAGAMSDPPDKGYSRFEDWLADQVALQGGPRSQSSPGTLLSVDGTDGLVPGSGAELVETRPAPTIHGYTTEGDRMAEVRRDGRTWFVVVRGHGPDAELIPVDADVLPEPTFAAFVDHVRAQVASGEGLR
jgi:hypothetical protein